MCQKPSFSRINYLMTRVEVVLLQLCHISFDTLPVDFLLQILLAKYVKAAQSLTDFCLLNRVHRLSKFCIDYFCTFALVIFSVICQEKTLQNIETFDKHKLKHAETEVKNPLPDPQGTQ